MTSLPPGVKTQFPRTVSEINALREAISPARLGTYLKSSQGNVRRAFDLYAWNVQASAALYPILQVNEITLRNAVHRALVSQFGTHWPYSQGFLRSLQQFERETFEKARTKLEAKQGVGRVSTDRVVASQTYWFWVMLLTARFENRVWKREFNVSFPNAPPQIDRKVVYGRADSIRLLRNRIAHYEPLLDHDLIGTYQRVVAMVRWISPTSAAWATLRWPADPAVLKRP
jgi:hypothetical protein